MKIFDLFKSCNGLINYFSLGEIPGENQGSIENPLQILIFHLNNSFTTFAHENVFSLIECFTPRPPKALIIFESKHNE